MLFVVKWVLVVGFVVAFEVCMCRNPVGFLGLLGFFGFFGFKWVLVGLFAFSDLSMLAFCVYVRMGIREEKCKIPLILPFLGSYLSFRL